MDSTTSGNVGGLQPPQKVKGAYPKTPKPLTAPKAKPLDHTTPKRK